MPKTVALLVGGWSAERQVSLDKGKEVEIALVQAGYDVRVIDVRKDMKAFIRSLEPRPDVVFNNLHGRGGEDGTIQAVLDMLEIPYTHSGVLASAAAMDKAMTKRLVQTIGVPSPQWAVMPLKDIATNNPVPKPFVVKPVNEGSSVGVYIINNENDLSVIENGSWAFDEKILVEQFIPGRELTVAVLEGEPQEVTEIRAKTEFFDYKAKYSDQSTEYVLPADIPENVYNKALDYAARVFKMLECRGLARCDFRYNDTSQGPQGLSFLEINTQPGLTAQSIGPSQVIYKGKTFPELCTILIENARCQLENAQKSQKPSSQPLHKGLQDGEKSGLKAAGDKAL